MQNTGGCFWDVSRKTRVVYDRVRKMKNYFEIPAFLQIERGKSRAGNSNSK